MVSSLVLLVAGGPLGCSPDPIRVEILPRATGSRVIVVGSRDEAPERVWITGPADTGAPLPAFELERALVVTVLEHDVLIDLPAGEYAIAGPGTPYAELPPAVRALGATVDEAHPVPEWATLGELPPLFVGLRVKVSCPPPFTTIAEPIRIPPYCDLMGPSVPERCYGRPARMRSLAGATTATRAPPIDRWHDEGYAIVREGDGADWMYFVSDRVVSAVRGNYTYPARMRMISATEADPSSFELIPILPHPRTGVPAPRGWSRPPSVRSDGLEMFFETSYPDAHWWDEEIYHAWRPSLDAPWSMDRAGVVRAISDPDNGVSETDMGDNDEIRSPVLLPDHRTLLYVAERTGQLLAARRPTTDPSDLAFASVPPPALPRETERGTLGSLAVSCDRQHLTYFWRSVNENGRWVNHPRIVEIRRLDPLELGQPRSLRIEGPPLVEEYSLAQSPDCETAYLAFFEMSAASAIPCP